MRQANIRAPGHVSIGTIKYAAEVEVDLIEDDTGWPPYLTVEDAERLDDVKQALVRGDIEVASKKARIYTLEPVAVSQ